ncbi:cuticle protein [Holotrichia oblita]|uniref:Cuticle protein n=1 Tax=Holotrichia oblita TaxID=644536 RepID=A0ACB9SQV4_HOLOL|nr:cuticle protein [Holotrichia oblita]
MDKVSRPTPTRRGCPRKSHRSRESYKADQEYTIYASQVIQRLSLLFLLLANANIIASTTTTLSTPALSKEDLDEAEANGKLEIIKQIKKVNEDGSYTIGYEADDGTFKIESRDVLGNIKGTYGYIDENGEIKRVSYSTNNGSEIVVPLKSSETSQSSSTSSVVQRIPKINKTVSSSSSTTRRPPSILYHSASTTGSPNGGGNTVVIQSIPKRRTTTTTTPTPSTTTTDPAKISEFIKAAVEASKSPTNRPNIYENASPRILLQQRALIRSNEDASLKSEGQIIRPDVIPRPTELPIYRRKAAPHLMMENEGGSEPKSNVLRRQLLPEKVNFDAKQHALNLQQSHGDDVVDVYTSSLSTGTTRPLFTTLRPKFISSTIPPTIQRPTIRYATSQNSPEFEQESSTENIRSTTTNTVSVAQIPPDNEQMQEALVAIRHPVHGRTVLVPLSQLQQINRYENVEFSEEPVQQPIYLSRSNHQRAQRFRPIQVRIDENGFVREMPQYQEFTTPYPVPVRVSPTPPDEDEINLIKPPVSTKDLQKLLEQLILRQTRLEQISYLTKRYQQMFGQRQRPIFRPNNVLVYQRRSPNDMSNLEQQNLYDYQSFGPTAESYTPTRRVARLLSAHHLRKDDQDENDNYLPADVREMLLLRMLQLAINPSLPLNIPDNFEEGFGASAMRHRKIGGARNVEILGEEDDTQKLMRSKR